MFARTLQPLSAMYVLVAVAALPLSGCLERKLKPLNPCLVSGLVDEIKIEKIDKVDLLFMVDNSKSMREEQESLRREFPKLISVLTTGVRSNGSPFPPAKDLHLGVVSSDMGLPGIEGIPDCKDLGDDGIMQNTPSDLVAGCQPSYPRFLSYSAGVNDPAQAATDFACIASLGTDGCGFEQQLEAALKALWPSLDIDPETGEQWVDPETGQPSNRIQFIGNVDGTGRLGQGDQLNAGFLRNDPEIGLSLIAIIMVTDEEDCSSADTSHFNPRPLQGDPLAQQDLNLRCFHNPQNLYPLERYIDGYKALRPDNDKLVIFGAIVGVPPDLVETADYDAVNWTDAAARNRFYDAILADPRMQETPGPSDEPGRQNLQPSCNEPGTGKAYPPRRIVEVARGFGANGTVHSICQEDLGPAVDAIIDVIAIQLGAVCLPRPLVRNSDGKVECNVVWELPPPAKAGRAPTECGAAGFEFLMPVGGDRNPTTEQGGAVCTVAQMAVLPDAAAPGGKKPVPTDNEGTTFSAGWYYDDFSQEATMDCTGETRQRVAFTANAEPPTGVTVKLECLNETQRLAHDRAGVQSGIEQPNIGDACEMVVRNGQPLSGDAACAVRLADGIMDTSMFCHPEQYVCVLGCATSIDCPDAWVCDERPETLAATVRDGHENGTAICVNPTCGDRND